MDSFDRQIGAVERRRRWKRQACLAGGGERDDGANLASATAVDAAAKVHRLTTMPLLLLYPLLWLFSRQLISVDCDWTPGQ